MTRYHQVSTVPGLLRLQWRGVDSPDASSVAGRLREEGVTAYAWSNGPGDRYAAHQHDFEKVLMCAAGSIVFEVGPDAVPVELHPGEGFVLPAGTRHSAIVGPGGVACLEGHR